MTARGGQGTGVPVPPGREAEAERLNAHVRAVASDGLKRCAFILGPAGIGKTTLLRWFAEHCRARRAGRGNQQALPVVLVRVPGAGLPPLFPVGPVAAGLVTACNDLRIPPPAGLERIAEALVVPGGGAPVTLPQIADALEGFGPHRPPVVLLDDYHAVPPEGARLLLGALRAVEAPLLLAATARPAALDGDHAPSPREPSADLWIEPIELGALNAESFTVLVERELGGPPLGSLVSTLHAQTLGNPLLATETLRSWRDTGLLQVVGGHWTTAAEPEQLSRGTLRDVITLRLRSLDPTAWAVAAAMAVIGRDAGARELRAVTRLEPEAMVTSLARLEEARLAVVHKGTDIGAGPRYRFAHPAYAEAVLDELTPARRAAIHQVVLTTLRSASTGGAIHQDGLNQDVLATDLAHHAVRSLEPPDDLESLLLRAAAEADAAGSYQEAARWYTHLIERAPDRRALLEALTRRANARLRFEPSGAVRDVDRALSLKPERETEGRLRLTRGYAVRLLGDLVAARDDARRAADLLTGEEQTAARHLVAAIHGIRGELDDAAQILTELRRNAKSQDERSRALVNLGALHFARGRIPAAIRSMRAAADAAESAFARLLALHNLAWSFLTTGQWDMAESTILVGLDVAQQHGDLWATVGFVSNGARLSAFRGQHENALDQATEAWRVALKLAVPSCEVDALDALGVALVEVERFQEALPVLSQAIHLVETIEERPDAALTYGTLAEALCRMGAIDDALHYIERADAGRRYPRFWAVATERVRALCLTTRGRPGEAIDVIDTFIPLAEHLPFERAKMLTARAEALVALRRRDDAVAVARHAHALFEALGARAWSARLDAMATRLSRKPGRPPLAGPGEFTPRERQVLDLLALGLTNREIASRLGISHRTVGKHVENMLARTGLERRSRLIARALEERSAQRDASAQQPLDR